MNLFGRQFAFVLLLLIAPLITAQERTGVAQTLGSSIRSGRLDDLRWPAFSNHRSQVDKFYRKSGYSAAWIRDSQPTDRAREMIEVLLRADTEGLNPDDYDGPRWVARLLRLQTAHHARDEARFDLALTVCAMRYMSDVRIGRVNPKHVQFRLNVGTKKLDLADFLRLVLSSSRDLESEFAQVEPPLAAYKSTRQALMKYLVMSRQSDGEQLPPPVGVVYRGGYYDHMPALAKRLRQLGDLPKTTVVFDNATTYGNPLLGAVLRFQQRHGLPPTGNLTSDTINELNVPLRARVEQLGLSLERYRWPRFNPQQPYVVVNLPGFRLTAYDGNGREAFSMGVVVGDAYDFQTPVLENNIRYVVFRPYWYITPTIFRNEVLPEMKKDRDFASDNDLEVITRSGKLIASGSTSGAALRNLSSGSLIVRQKPGPNNALGLVKIIFPNKHHVYLHDTPERRTLFSEEQELRAQSHGCIHVERPAQLVQWLLRDRPEWTMERIDRAMRNAPDENLVTLTRPIPILITYETAHVSPDGEVHFYSDIYGHDAHLEKALAEGYPHVSVPANELTPSIASSD